MIGWAWSALKQNFEDIALIVFSHSRAAGGPAAGVKLDLNDRTSVANEHGFALIYTWEVAY